MTAMSAARDRSQHRGGAEDVALAFGARVGVVLLALLVQAMLARMLLPEGRGSYAVCLVFATALGMVLTPGAQQGAQQFVMTRTITTSEAVSCAFLICLVGGGLGALIALPLMSSGFPYFLKADVGSFHIALAILPILAFALAVEHQLAALRRFGRLALALLLRMVVNVLAVVVLVWACGLGVDGALWALVCSEVVMVAACLSDLRRHCGLVFHAPRWEALRRILGYGLRYHVARTAEGLGPHVGVFFLGLLASDAQIGLFAAASTLMIAVLLVSNSVGNALLPRIAIDKYAKSPLASGDAASVGRPELVATCLRLVCMVTVTVLVGIVAIGAPLVRALFSEAFLASLPLLWLIAPGMLAGAGAGIFMTYFKAVNRPGICSWVQFAGLSIEIVALVLLFRWYGIAAAAAAVTVGATCRCALLAFLFHKSTGQSWRYTWLPKIGDYHFLVAAIRSLVGLVRFRKRGEAT